ncbi:Uncharacterised protein [Mycobacterium tuberculosis]|nr:Uncharacterised protein [Mycobacterium tuberculosis]
MKPEAAKVLGAQDDVLQLAVRFGAHRNLTPPIVAATAPLGPQPIDIQFPGVANAERTQQLGRAAGGIGDLAATGR